MQVLSQLKYEIKMDGEEEKLDDDGNGLVRASFQCVD